MRAAAVLALMTIGFGAAHDASAQTRDRILISVNGGFQGTRNAFTDRFEFEANRETGSTETQYPVEGGLVIDGSVAFRLWKNLGAGIGVSQFTRDEVARTDSRVPHPLYDEMLRQVGGDVSRVARTERAVHVQAVYEFRVGRPIRGILSGGPSFLRLEQDVVTSIEYDDRYPYETATFRRADTRRARGSGVGFNAGADVAWMFTRHVGIGGGARFAKATVDLDLAGGRPIALDAGGLSGGAGLRFLF